MTFTVHILKSVKGETSNKHDLPLLQTYSDPLLSTDKLLNIKKFDEMLFLTGVVTLKQVKQI